MGAVAVLEHSRPGDDLGHQLLLAVGHEVNAGDPGDLADALNQLDADQPALLALVARTVEAAHDLVGNVHAGHVRAQPPGGARRGQRADADDDEKTAKWEGHFGLLAAATPAIDRHWNFFAELGERYIRINLRTRREEQTRMALQQMGTEDAMREELREAGAQLLTHYKNTTLEPPRLSKSFRDRVLDIAEVTAVLRTHVIRDNNHDIPIMPEPEVGTRLGKQMLKLAQAVAFLYEKTEPGDFEHSLLLRAAIDALQPRRLRVLKALI